MIVQKSEMTDLVIVTVHVVRGVDLQKLSIGLLHCLWTLLRVVTKFVAVVTLDVCLDHIVLAGRRRVLKESDPAYFFSFLDRRSVCSGWLLWWLVGQQQTERTC